jgi:hypothetical protein
MLQCKTTKAVYKSNGTFYCQPQQATSHVIQSTLSALPCIRHLQVMKLVLSGKENYARHARLSCRDLFTIGDEYVAQKLIRSALVSETAHKNKTVAGRKMQKMAHAQTCICINSQKSEFISRWIDFCYKST